MSNDWTNTKDKIRKDLPSINENHKPTAVQQTQRPFRPSLQTKLRQFHAIKYKCIKISFEYMKCKVYKLIHHVLYAYTNCKSL